MGTKRTSVLASLIWLGCLLSGEARATSLEITPITVHFVPGTNATTIEIANRGGVAAAIQLRAFAWRQDGNKDVLTPTQDIIISPPIFALATDGSQTIRLMLRRTASAAGERTYRLLIDEVPPANFTPQQVAVAMRLSLPLIIGSAAARERPLQWRAARQPNGRIMLSATNSGSAFERVQSLSVTTADGREQAVSTTATNSYVLAGAQRQWVVSAADNARELKLSITTRTGQSEQVLAIAP